MKMSLTAMMAKIQDISKPVNTDKTENEEGKYGYSY